MSERTDSPIEFVDLRRHHARLRSQLSLAMDRVVDQAAFIGGAEVSEFEAEFANFVGRDSCVGVGNGTDALVLALRAAGVGPGDEVITVAHTFIATTEAIAAVGAVPVLIDIRPDTMLMDTDRLDAAVGRQTRAILPVHLNGQMVDMGAVRDVANRHGLVVIEDAAQAHGALWDGQGPGAGTHAACYSFYPGKNLGAFGDAGAVVSDDHRFIDEIRRVANHGRTSKYLHETIGVNSRLDGLQAAILRVKLADLRAANARRSVVAARYDEAFGDIAELPGVATQATPVWHVYAIRIDARDEARDALARAGIPTGIHYPIPVHRNPAFAGVKVAGSLDVTDRTVDRLLSLPMHPELTDGEIERIITAVRAVVSG